MTAQASPPKTLTPELRTTLTKRTDSILLNVITANLPTQYASQAPSLAPFRAATSARGTAVDATLLKDFRDHVPVTDYESYKPWIDRFDEKPCKESRVDNLFAPGLPFNFAMTSSTSGKEPKLFPSYQHPSLGSLAPRPGLDFSDTQGPVACVFYFGYTKAIDVEREGQVVHRIPICLVSAGRIRGGYYWDIASDESRLSTIMPGQVAPWGASMITPNRSFLLIHGLFCLVCPDLDQIFVIFATTFADLVRCVDEEWDMLLVCIRDGEIPDLDDVHHLRVHLKAAFKADPDRAGVLRKIGPPSSGDGWAARVWPRLRRLGGICNGPFGMCLPKLRAILGPTVAIRNHGYGSSESYLAVFYDPNDTETLVFETEDMVEFVDAEGEGLPSKIFQGWDVEAGRRYQVVVTTRNGLWRYLIDDIIEIVGFDHRNGSPVFKHLGRKTSGIQLPHVTISDAELVTAIQSISSEEFITVHDFTTVLDMRKLPHTIGYFVELSGQLGPNAHMSCTRLFEALGAANRGYLHPIQSSEACLPTIRVVKPGTFMEYRRWRGEKMGIGLGQIKVPVVSLHAEWITERVTQEL